MKRRRPIPLGDDLGSSRAEAKGKKAQEFMNEDVLRELDKQGFFKSLQKRS